MHCRHTTCVREHTHTQAVCIPLNSSSTQLSPLLRSENRFSLPCAWGFAFILVWSVPHCELDLLICSESLSGSCCLLCSFLSASILYSVQFQSAITGHRVLIALKWVSGSLSLAVMKKLVTHTYTVHKHKTELIHLQGHELIKHTNSCIQILRKHTFALANVTKRVLCLC